MSDNIELVILLLLVFVMGFSFGWLYTATQTKVIEENAQEAVLNWSVNKCQSYLLTLREINSSLGEVYEEDYNAVISDNITWPWDQS